MCHISFKIGSSQLKVTEKELNTICDSIWQDGPCKVISFSHTDTMAMKEAEPKESNEPASGWHVYIICCMDNSYYTGITTDLMRRMDEHNSAKKGAKYTRTRRPVELVYSEKAASRSIATRREDQIKKLPLTSKRQLIKTYQPAGRLTKRSPDLL